MSTVEDVLGHEGSARVVVLVNGHGPEGRCIGPCEVQADCGDVCDAKDTGLCLAQVIATSTVRDNPDSVCTEDTCRRWLFLLMNAAELLREWQHEMAMVQLDVKKAFDQWTIERRSKR